MLSKFVHFLLGRSSEGEWQGMPGNRCWNPQDGGSAFPSTASRQQLPDATLLRTLGGGAASPPPLWLSPSLSFSIVLLLLLTRLCCYVCGFLELLLVGGCFWLCISYLVPGPCDALRDFWRCNFVALGNEIRARPRWKKMYILFVYLEILIIHQI